jgi:hypothetical protein
MNMGPFQTPGQPPRDRDFEDHGVVRQAFDQGMTMLSAAYGKGAITPAQIAVYWRVLGSLDVVRMEKAFDGALNSERFMPSPATLRAYAGEKREEWKQEFHLQKITPEEFAQMRKDVQALKAKIAANMSAPYAQRGWKEDK